MNAGRGCSASRGFTLISTMVGMLLSLLISLGMLAMFRMEAREVTRARLGSGVDDQLVASILRAQASAQDAGFNLPAAAHGTQIVVLANALLNGSKLTGTATSQGMPGNALVWASRTSGVIQCAGIVYDSNGDGSGGMKYLNPVDCATVADFSTRDWTVTSWVASPALANAGPVSFVLVAGSCTPFGQSGLVASLKLAITSVLSTGIPVTDAQCLANFRS